MAGAPIIGSRIVTVSHIPKVILIVLLLLLQAISFRGVASQEPVPCAREYSTLLCDTLNSGVLFAISTLCIFISFQLTQCLSQSFFALRQK